MPNANDQATYGDAFVTYGDVEWTYDGTRLSTIRPRRRRGRGNVRKSGSPAVQIVYKNS